MSRSTRSLSERVAAMVTNGAVAAPWRHRRLENASYPPSMTGIGSTDIVPLLACSDIAAEHDFLVTVLGFSSVGIERTPDGAVVHAEVRAGERRIWLHR